MSAVLDALARWAGETPHASALTDGRRTWSWASLRREVEATADRLDEFLRDVPVERPVAIALDNGPAWIVLDLALVRLGRPCLPLPPFFTPEQRRHALADAGAGLLASAPAAVASPIVIVAGQAVAVQGLAIAPVELHPGTAKITYTSGSTGTPRGVCLSQAQQEAVAASLVEVIGADYAGRHLAVLPLGVLLENVAGFYPTVMAGGCYDVRPLAELGFAAGTPDLKRLADAVDGAGATSLILAPELLRGLMAVLAATGRRLPSLELVAVGGAKVSPQLIAGARALGLPAFEGYGLSECGSVVALNTPHADRPGSVGRVLPHLSAAIAGDGEIVVGPQPFLGYVGGPPHAGAWRTGDLGAIDADGWLTITGRKSNVLITAYGRNVSPEWVESELLAEPEIVQAAVFGEAAAALCALLVPSRADLPPRAVAEAVGRANARLPDYARLDRWRVSAPFAADRGEVTANGRPRRQVLQAAHHDFIETPSESNEMSFLDQLERATADERAGLYGVRQLVDGVQGRITRETYLAYLAQAYHHVRHTVPLLTLARDGMDAAHAVFRTALDAYISEEIGHEQWILNDIARAGGDADTVRRSAPAPATELMVAFAYDYVGRVNPMGMFGMVYVLEGTSIALATAGASAVSKALGLGPECFSYLSSHGALDQDHMVFFAGLMDQVEDPSDRAAIVHVARRVFGLFAEMFRAIPHTPELAHAV